MDFFFKVKDVQVIFPYMFYISKGFKVHQREDECLCVCILVYYKLSILKMAVEIQKKQIFEFYNQLQS